MNKWYFTQVRNVDIVDFAHENVKYIKKLKLVKRWRMEEGNYKGNN